MRFIACGMTGLFILAGLVIALTVALPIQEGSLGSTGAGQFDPGCPREEWEANNFNCNASVAEQLREKFAEYKKLVARELNQGTDFEYQDDDVDEVIMDDMLLDADQVNWLVQEEEIRQEKRSKRQIRRDFPTGQWTTPVPFMIDSSLASYRKLIWEAINFWASATCISFKEYQIGEVPNGAFIIFTAPTSFFRMGCQSFIGRVSDDKSQPILLSASCMTAGVIAHEIGHALGFVHEHQRPDRDEYIRVRTDNIISSKYAFFKTFDHSKVTTMDVPYDYTSDMHYKAIAYSMNRDKTIETKDPRFQSSIGQRVELSFYDTLLANKAYCANTCDPYPKLQCLHHGYMDPHDCNTCRCPDGWSGKLCDEVQPYNGAPCGGILIATSTVQTLTTPGYELNKPYNIKQECYWLIQAGSPDARITAGFVGEFGIYCSFSDDHCVHWVELRTDRDLGRPSPRYCCTETPDVNITSESNQLLVIFKGKDAFAANRDRKGFKLQFYSDGDECSTTPCQNGGTCTGDQGKFTCSCKDGFSGDLCETPEFNFVAPMDLGILIDAKHRPDKDFDSFKYFAKEFVNEFDVGDDDTQVGLISFHEYAERQTSLSPDLTNSDIVELIDGIQESHVDPGSTNFFSAMWFMVENMFDYKDGDRLDVMDIAVMIVDNPAYFWLDTALLSRQRSTMQQRFIHLIIVCVGEYVDLNLMEYLAGSRDNLVIVDSYSDLYKDSTMKKLVVKVQEQNYKMAHTPKSTSATTPTPTTTTTTTKKPTTTTTTTTTTKRPTTTSTTTTTTTRKPTTTTTTTKKPTTTTTTTTTKKPTTTTTTTTKKPTTTTTTTTTKKPTTTTTTTIKKPTTTTTTTMTTTTQTPLGDVDVIFRENCWYDSSNCSRTCGGCGQRRVQHKCETAPGVYQLGWSYHEECCHLEPCWETCKRWVGRLYEYDCNPSCSAGYSLTPDNSLCLKELIGNQ